MSNLTQLKIQNESDFESQSLQIELETGLKNIIFFSRQINYLNFHPLEKQRTFKKQPTKNIHRLNTLEKSYFQKINFYLCKKLIFLYVLNHFDMLILKIILKNKKILF